MIELKEALIGKKNISSASPYSSLYCIANYDDDLDLIGDDIVTVQSKDRVTIYILSEKETIKYSEEIEEMDCNIWRVNDPKLSIKDIEKKISNSIWKNNLDKKLCEQIFFTTIKEALIGKHNIKNASTKNQDLYLVNAYNEYYDYLHAHYLNKEIIKHGLFIIEKDDIMNMIKHTDRNGLFRYVDICQLTGFNKKMLSEFKKDLEDIDYLPGNMNRIIMEYGFVKIDINDLL